MAKTVEQWEEVHARWAQWRELQEVAQQLRQLCKRVPPSVAPRAAAKLRRALKSVDGAVRHASHMHNRARESGRHPNPPMGGHDNTAYWPGGSPNG
jgi:hypothetical protein